MAILNRYRNLAAALLVLLYAFVAMPVQWWHHHAPAVLVSAETFAEAFTRKFNSPGLEGKIVARAGGNIAGEHSFETVAVKESAQTFAVTAGKVTNSKKTKHTNSAFSDDCPICSHQYASHDGVVFALTLSIPNTPTQFLAEQLIVLPSLPAASFSNIGPPALS